MMRNNYVWKAEPSFQRWRYVTRSPRSGASGDWRDTVITVKDDNSGLFGVCVDDKLVINCRTLDDARELGSRIYAGSSEIDFAEVIAGFIVEDIRKRLKQYTESIEASDKAQDKVIQQKALLKVVVDFWSTDTPNPLKDSCEEINDTN